MAPKTDGLVKTPSAIGKFLGDTIRKFTGKKKKKKKKHSTAKQVGGEFAKGVDALARIRGRTKLGDR